MPDGAQMTAEVTLDNKDIGFRQRPPARGDQAPGDVIPEQVYDGYYGYTALELSIAGTTDKAFISGFFYGNNPAATGANPIQQIEFADGTIWDMQSILAKVYAGTNADDTLTGTIGNDSFSDSCGNDMLNGGLGNDSYRFGRNSGRDVISDYGGSKTGVRRR